MIVKEVPKGWKKEKLLKIAPLQRGFDLTSSEVAKGKYPVVFSNGINAYHKVYKIKAPGITTGRSGTIGKIFFMKKDFWPHNTTLWVTSFFNNNPLFIYHVFNLIPWKQFSTGSGVPTLNRNDIHEFEIILPKDPYEQKAIADALSDADKLIESLEKLIVKKKAIKQGTMQQLLTGKTRLPQFVNSSEWKEIKLGSIGKIFNGLQGKTKKDFGVGNARYISFLNVLNNIVVKINQAEKVQVYSNEIQNQLLKLDLLFNTSSETPDEVGMCSVVLDNPKKVYLNSFCFIFRLQDTKKYNALYFAYFLRSKEGRTLMSSIAQGSTRYNLSKTFFNQLKLPIPPTIDEQNAIAEILSDMDSEIEALENKLTKYHQIKLGMMSDLLTGKIRLVEPQIQVNHGIQQTQQKKPAYNEKFDDAVTIAGIVNAFDSPTFPLGRKKVQKLLYLLKRKKGSDTSSFEKKAAGPYSADIRYNGGEAIAKNSHYIIVEKGDKGSVLKRGQEIAKAMEYIKSWNKEQDITWLISEFQYTGVKELETLATVDNAICDLEEKGIEISLQHIKDYIASIDEWKAKLSKTHFNDMAILSAMGKRQALFNS